MKQYNLKRYYGLDWDTYQTMLKTANNRCEICGEAEPKAQKSLSVDHCHETGQIRGLLCSNCNPAIGHMKNDPALLRKAALYLEAAKQRSLPQPPQPATNVF
jgi:hypothetical protein